MPFEQLLNNIKAIRSNLPDIFTEALLSNEKEITDANRENLMAGELSTGKGITPLYAESTQKRKGQANPNLFDTGGFHASLFVSETNRPGELVVASDEIRDGKPLALELEETYSSDIYGIKDEQLDEIFEGSTGDKIIKKIEDGITI